MVARSFLNALLYGLVIGVLAQFWKQLHADRPAKFRE